MYDKARKGVDIMDEGRLKAAGVDYDMALERFVGNRMLYEKFLNKYVEDELAVKTREAYERESYHEMLEAVHALKGVSGTLGMDALYKVSAEIVNALRSEDYTDLDSMMERLQEEHEKMVALLKE